MSLWTKLFGTRVSPAERQLLKRCLGDSAQLERLIAHELERRPQSRASASQAALDRWSRR